MRRAVGQLERDVIMVGKKQGNGGFFGGIGSKDEGDHPQSQDQITQVIGGCRDQCHLLAKQIEAVSESIQRDLIDGIDVFDKHY